MPKPTDVVQLRAVKQEAVVKRMPPVRNINASRMPRLYHYQSFDVERLTPIFLESRLYFSRPSAFNDPWDCRVCYDLRRLASDAKKRARLATDFLRIDIKHNPPRSAEQYVEIYNSLANDAAQLEKTARELNAGMHRTMDENYRIYSLASSPLTALMWSHYADKHTGVCLEFVVDDTLFGAALKVQYSTRYPSLPVFAEARDQLLEFLLKSADWSYEREYRMVVPERRFRPNDILVVDDHWIRFQPHVLSAVIAGCQMSDQRLDELRALLSRSPSPIQLKRAVRHEDRYELRVEPI